MKLHVSNNDRTKMLVSWNCMWFSITKFIIWCLEFFLVLFMNTLETFHIDILYVMAHFWTNICYKIQTIVFPIMVLMHQATTSLIGHIKKKHGKKKGKRNTIWGHCWPCDGRSINWTTVGPWQIYRDPGSIIWCYYWCDSISYYGCQIPSWLSTSERINQGKKFMFHAFEKVIQVELV